MSKYVRKIITVDGKQIQLARHLVEVDLGRKLKYNEIVHHVNGNTLDDRPDNLQVMTRRQHTSFHNSGGYINVSPEQRRIIAGRNGMKNSKLTENAIRNIRVRLMSGETGRSIALCYGTSNTAISNIRSGKTYSWIE